MLMSSCTRLVWLETLSIKGDRIAERDIFNVKGASAQQAALSFHDIAMVGATHLHGCGFQPQSADYAALAILACIVIPVGWMGAAGSY